MRHLSRTAAAPIFRMAERDHPALSAWVETARGSDQPDANRCAFCYAASRSLWGIRNAMTEDIDLLDRVSELEERTQRLVLAGDDLDGSGAWTNYVETRLMQERDLSRGVLAGALAEIQQQILDACKTVITEALSQRK